MSQQFRVTQGELQQRAGEMRSIADQLQQELGDAGRRVDALLGDWIGNASDAFRELWEGWQQAANTCHQDLMSIADAMEKVGTGFQDQEQEAARGIRAMRG